MRYINLHFTYLLIYLLSLRWADRILRICEGQRPTSGREKAISQSNYSSVNAMVTLLYRTLQLALGYDTAIRRMWMIGCRQQLCI